MSTQNSNNTTYKFGDSDLNLKDYIHNLETNYLSYVNSLNLSLSLQKLFRASYDLYLKGLRLQDSTNSARFSTRSDGSIIDLEGKLGNEDQFLFYFDNKGNGITADEWRSKNKWGKRKYTLFEANKEVATYLNEVGKALRDAVELKLADRTPKTPETNKFDFTEHGFVNWFLKELNPSGGDFNYNPYLEQYPDNNSRATFLKELLEKYIDSIDNDIDFSESPFGNRDEYITRLRNAISNLSNGYSAGDTIALNNAGINLNFLNSFFPKPEEQKDQGELAYQASEKAVIEALRAKKTLENLSQAREIQEDIAYNNFLTELSNRVPLQYTYQNIGTDGNISNIELLVRSDKKNGAIYLAIDSDNLFKYLRGKGELNLTSYAQQGIDLYDWEKGAPLSSNINLSLYDRLLLLSYIINNNESFKGTQDGYFILPGSESEEDYTIIEYNPVTNLYLMSSIANIPNGLYKTELLKDLFKRKYNNLSFKEGGILKALYGVSLEELITQKKNLLRLLKLEKSNQLKLKLLQEELLEEPIQDSRTLELKEAGQRKLSDSLTGTDLARIAAIGMDLTSAISSFVPGVGTALSGLTGIGSTITTLGADIAEDGFQWSDLRNAGVGLGMDIAGLLPGFGTAGKATKIGKLLAKFAPVILGSLQAYNALSEPSRKSWGKIINGKFNDLTVDDLRNLASGITAFTSLSNLVGIRMKNAAMKSATKTGDKLIETKTGEMIKVTPEKLKEIQDAKTLEEANNVLLSIPEYKDKELVSTFRSAWNPTRLWNHNPKTGDYYDWSKLKGTIFDKKGFLPSDASLFLSVRESNIGNMNLHLNSLNPYNRLLNQAAKPTKKKLGGTLNLSKVRKFLSGSSVTGIKYKPAQPKLNSKINFLSDLGNNPTILYDLPRAVFADLFNKKIIDKTFLKPLLLEPFEFNRYVRSDLDAEALALKDYALLRSLAQRPLTSDGALLEAMLLLATLEGLKRFEAGKAKSNEVQRQYNELSLQLQKENALNVHNTAMANREKILDIDKARSAVELAYLSKKHNIWDTLWLLLEFDKKSELQENKTLRYKFAVSQIHDMVSKNLGKYAPELSPESVNLYYLVANGNILPSELSKDPAKWQLFLKAQSAASKAELELQRLYFDIPKLNFGDNTSENTWNATITFKDKKGGKLDKSEKIYKANLKAKMEDTKRFNKNVKDSIDRNEKAITRLYKSTKKKK